MTSNSNFKIIFRIFLILQQPNFGNSAGSFADVLTSTYGLGIPDYGDETDMGGGTESGSHHHHHHHHHHGLEDSGHCIGSYHGSSDHYGDPPSHQHPPHPSSSPFADVLPDTFHAEFITQPIDYPMGGVSPPPAPPPLTLISRGPHTPSSAGSPAQISGSPASSPISPSHTLPSFLDTYSVGSSGGASSSGRHHVLEALSPHTPQPTTLEPRFTFKTEPSTSSCETVATPAPSSYASHYQAQQQQQQQQNYTFLKKEPVYTAEASSPSPVGGYNSMSDFYQPPTPYSQFQSTSGSSGGDYSYHSDLRSSSGEHPGTLPASLQGALQGAMGGARNRRQLITSSATSSNP